MATTEKQNILPHIIGPIAESFMIERLHNGNREWLTPERTWDRSIFEGARFELNEREKAEWWLNRELIELTEGGPQIPHKSIVTWPPEVKLGNPDGSNESTDTHPSKDAAEAVCRLLRKHGFGGEGKHFPISTRVEPIHG